jgi:hypothetical protein
MSLNRGPFNALIDEPIGGDNTTGSVWNKGQIQAVVLDPVDAELGRLESTALAKKYETVLGSTVTGTVNDWNLGWNGHTYISWFGSGLITITGFGGGVAGQRITFKNASGSSLALFVPFSASSLTASRFVNPVTSAPMPVGPGGWIVYEYDGGNWFVVGYEQGAWITPAYNAAAFTGNANNWTVDAGDVTTLRYCLRGRTLTVAFTLSTTSIAVGNTELRILNSLYGGFTAASVIYAALALGYVAGTISPAQIQTQPGYLVLKKNDSTAWGTDAANASYFYGQITFDVT